MTTKPGLKAKVGILLFAVLLAFGPSLLDPSMKARNSFVVGDGYAHIADLPGKDHPKAGGRNLELAWKHSYFAVFWLPFWGSTDGEFVLYLDRGQTSRYWRISEKKAKELGRSVGLELGNTSPISPYSLYWGWIVILPLLLALGGILGLEMKRRL